MADIKTSDVGTKVKLESGEDLTDTSAVKIYAMSPLGVVSELSAAVVENTKVQHVKAVDTLDKVGNWILTIYAEWADGSHYDGDPMTIPVIAPQRPP